MRPRAERRRGLVLAAGLCVACSPDASLELDARRPGELAMFGPPASPTAVPTDGFWIGVELVGPSAARADAAQTAREGLQRPPLGEVPPPGETLGWVPARGDALAFLQHHAFTEAADGSAPLPGGPIAARFDVVVESFVVTAVGSDPFAFTDAELEERGWMLADLGVDRAPLFAAPSPVLPPAREAHAVAAREGELWVVDRLERCRGSDCIRWVAVLARTGDRWVPGYLPAAVVAPRRFWVPSPDALPRATAVASSRHGGRVHYVVLARDPSGRLHRDSTDLPGDAFVPGLVSADADVHLEDDAVVLHGEDGAVSHVPIPTPEAPTP